MVYFCLYKMCLFEKFTNEVIELVYAHSICNQSLLNGPASYPEASLKANILNTINNTAPSSVTIKVERTRSEPACWWLPCDEHTSLYANTRSKHSSSNDRNSCTYRMPYQAPNCHPPKIFSTRQRYSYEQNKSQNSVHTKIHFKKDHLLAI